MSDHVKAAGKYVAGHEPGDVHPDVAQAMHRFETARDRDEGDVAVAAHAESLMDMVASLGDANVAPEPDPRHAFMHESKPKPARRPAKKSAARKSAGSRSRG